MRSTKRRLMWVVVFLVLASLAFAEGQDEQNQLLQKNFFCLTLVVAGPDVHQGLPVVAKLEPLKEKMILGPLSKHNMAILLNLDIFGEYENGEGKIVKVGIGDFIPDTDQIFDPPVTIVITAPYDIYKFSNDKFFVSDPIKEGDLELGFQWIPWRTDDNGKFTINKANNQAIFTVREWPSDDRMIAYCD